MLGSNFRFTFILLTYAATSTQLSAKDQGDALWTEAGFTDEDGVKSEFDLKVAGNNSRATVDGSWTVSFDQGKNQTQSILQIAMPQGCSPALVVHSTGSVVDKKFNIGMSVPQADYTRLILPFRLNDTSYIGSFNGVGDTYRGEVKDTRTGKTFAGTLTRSSQPSRLTSQEGQATFDVKPNLDGSDPLVRDPLQGFMTTGLIKDLDEPEKGFICYGINKSAGPRFFYTGAKIDLNAKEQPLNLVVQFWDFGRVNSLTKWGFNATRYETPLRLSGTTEGGSMFLYFAPGGATNDWPKL